MVHEFYPLKFVAVNVVPRAATVKESVFGIYVVRNAHPPSRVIIEANAM